MRECGGCTICCYVAACPELNKPHNVWCPFRVKGGCGIHSRKPQSCRKWECYWLSHPEISENLRPDLCGVMIEPLEGTLVSILYVDGKRPDAWKSDDVTKVIGALLDAGQSLVIKSKQKYIFPAPGRTLDSVWLDVVNFGKRVGVI